MRVFLILALFPMLATFLGVKALFPPGIQLSETRTLSRRTSAFIGIATTFCSLATIGVLYAYLVLRVPMF